MKIFFLIIFALSATQAITLRDYMQGKIPVDDRCFSDAVNNVDISQQISSLKSQIQQEDDVNGYLTYEVQEELYELTVTVVNDETVKQCYNDKYPQQSDVPWNLIDRRCAESEAEGHSLLTSGVQTFTEHYDTYGIHTQELITYIEFFSSVATKCQASGQSHGQCLEEAEDEIPDISDIIQDIEDKIQQLGVADDSVPVPNDIHQLVYSLTVRVLSVEEVKKCYHDKHRQQSDVPWNSIYSGCADKKARHHELSINKLATFIEEYNQGTYTTSLHSFIRTESIVAEKCQVPDEKHGGCFVKAANKVDIADIIYDIKAGIEQLKQDDLLPVDVQGYVYSLVATVIYDDNVERCYDGEDDLPPFDVPWESIDPKCAVEEAQHYRLLVGETLTIVQNYLDNGFSLEQLEMLFRFSWSVAENCQV